MRRSWVLSMVGSSVLMAVSNTAGAAQLQLIGNSSYSSMGDVASTRSVEGEGLAVSLSGNQYADQKQLNARLDLRFSWKSANRLHEVGVTSFVDFGPSGNMTFDPDPVVVRARIGSGLKLFGGRTHPMVEGAFARKPGVTDAIGAAWAQNQLDAINPRVTGWIGAGLTWDLIPNGGLSLVSHYSPLYLPNFVPSLGIDAEGKLNASRFAHLPPQWVQYERGMMPIRYKLELPPTGEIVRQDQAYIALEHASTAIQTGLSAWSAPRPDFRIQADGVLGASSSSLAALVTARPVFPRELNVGYRLRLPRLWATPELQVVLPSSSEFTFLSGGLVSVSVQPVSFFSMGYMEALGSTRAKEAHYTDRLVWTEARLNFMRRWSLGGRLEQHLLSNRTGRYLNTTLEYAPRSNLAFYAKAGLITGDDNSYFGAWRGTDFVSVGARSVW